MPFVSSRYIVKESTPIQSKGESASIEGGVGNPPPFFVAEPQPSQKLALHLAPGNKKARRQGEPGDGGL